MDVKYVPIVCYVGTDGEKFYQYTMNEEATRERFIYAYKEQSSYSTVDFVQRAIVYFGYAPDMIQADNGSEFTHIQEWLGHSDIATTPNIYTHLDYSNKVSAANAILPAYPKTFRIGAVGQ